MSAKDTTMTTASRKTIKASILFNGRLRTYRVSDRRQVELHRTPKGWKVVTLYRTVPGVVVEGYSEETTSGREAARWVKAEVRAEYRASRED
jgi:hypothetical protein